MYLQKRKSQDVCCTCVQCAITTKQLVNMQWQDCPSFITTVGGEISFELVIRDGWERHLAVFCYKKSKSIWIKLHMHTHHHPCLV